MLVGEPAPGPAEPGLDLVEDQEHAARVAQAPELAQISVRRHDDAGLALDRLDQHRAGILGDRGRDRGGVAERHRPEAAGERPEPVAVGGVGGKADDRGGAAVEVLLGHDDLGPVGRDALDPVAPAPRRLDRRLDRLRAGVHRQRPVEAGEVDEALQERRQHVRVIGAARHREPGGLLGHRLEDAGMRRGPC